MQMLQNRLAAFLQNCLLITRLADSDTDIDQASAESELIFKSLFHSLKVARDPKNYAKGHENG